MTRYVALILLLASCQPNTSDRIVIPQEMSIGGRSVLDQIMEKSVDEPTNERLLLQELYYCEELNWPNACGQTLLRAKRRWGLTDKLVDQMVAYHLARGNVDELDGLLKGKIETRSRLEAKIEIGASKNRDISNLLARHLDHYSDKEAAVFALNYYLLLNDTTQAIVQFEKVREITPTDKSLRGYYPILIENNDYTKAINIIDNQLVISPKDSVLLFDLALALNKIGRTDSSRIILRNMKSLRANKQMADWYRTDKYWDSTLLYIDKVLVQQPDDRSILLYKAETLESKRWITRSLPYYERVLAMDTTDNIMARRVEIVRRKVAYLRQIREPKRPAPILNLKRKTTTDN